jgi:acetyltransferase-like isoleucine patch superfamily enzyme
MERITKLERWKDHRGNEIVYDGDFDQPVNIRVRGHSNRLIVAPDANVEDLTVTFHGDNGFIEIGPTTVRRAPLRLELRVGHDSSLTIGTNVGTAGRTFISAIEGADVTIGDDVMFAKHIEVRTDDTHPIFDVRTRQRVNVSRSIHVGAHVWLAKHCVVMGGVTIGDGAVIGFRSIVTRSVPNNCVAVGAPARVVRRDVAWARPETVARKPGELYPREGDVPERYWNLSPMIVPGAGVAPLAPASRAVRAVRRLAAAGLRRTR